MSAALILAFGFWGVVSLVVWLIEANERAEMNRVLRKVFDR